MEEITIGILITLMGVNVAATFKILFVVGGLEQKIAAIKDRVKNLEGKENQHEKMA